MTSRTCRRVGWVVLALAWVPMAAAAQQGAAGGEWRSYAGDTGSTKYSPLAQITPENVGELAVAWRWESADGRFDLDNFRAYYPALQIGNDTGNVSINGLKGTPLMVGGTLYLTTALSQVAAVDAATGVTRWIHDPQSYASGIPIMVLGFSSRGLPTGPTGRRSGSSGPPVTPCCMLSMPPPASRWRSSVRVAAST